MACCEHHPDTSISEPTCRDDVNDIARVKMLKRRKHVVSETTDGLNADVSIRELLEIAQFSPGKQQEIVAVFSDVETADLLFP